MISTRQNIVLFFLALELAFCAAARVPECNKVCGSNTVSFPFGFSEGCPIRLNCSAAGEMQLGGYRVRNITSEKIILDVPPACDRPVASNAGLFGRHYAMTSSSALFMRKCNRTAGFSVCSISTEIIASRLNLSRCGRLDDDISCFSSSKMDGFLTPEDFREATAHCKFLFVSVRYGKDAYGQPSLVLGAAEVGWWLSGECQCAANATCKRLNVPDKSRMSSGFRCCCNEGFVGDGFSEGTGCIKEVCSSGASGDRRDSFRAGLLAGSIAAGVFLLLAVAVLCNRLRRLHVPTSKDEEAVNRSLLSETFSNITIYSHKDVQRATRNFSDASKLGVGAYATVYVGEFPDTGLVAIKRLKHPDSDNFEHLTNEVKLASSVRHPNLVRLLGCCIERGEHILVYEFVPNGTLAQHLRRERGEGLSWPARVSISAETAEAIAYLHTAVQPPIYHRDIKSSNILLDFDLKPKLADFGLSRIVMEELSHISTAPQGTPGYVDPQYQQNFHLSDRSDVYSFGVVLVEMITAMKAVDFRRAPSEVNLASMAGEAIRNGHVEDIVDPFVKGTWDGRTKASVKKVAELAFRCLAFHSEARPAMEEVAEELERIRTEGQRGVLRRMRSTERAKAASPDSVQFHRGSERSRSSNGSLTDLHS